MDAIITLKAANDLDWRQVESMEVGLPQTGVNIIGEPQDDKRNPKNYVDGQFSMPFVAAVALRDGGMDWDSYERHLADAETLDLCRRVSTISDPVAEAEYPANMSAVVRLHTAAGMLEQLVVVPKGEPGNFMAAAELRSKFDGLVAPYLSESRRDELSRRLLALHQEPDVSALLALTRPDQAGGHLRVAATGAD
jgi:2-methylcitrate dehydratase PrpD